MEVMVLWSDGSVQMVFKNNLESSDKCLKLGSKVKMQSGIKWLNGEIVDMEEDVSDILSNSSDDIPLAQMKSKFGNNDNKNDYESENVVHVLQTQPLYQELSIASPLILITNTGNADVLQDITNLDENKFSNNVEKSSAVVTREQNTSYLSDHDPFSDVYDSDKDPEFTTTCEANNCETEIFSSCHRCQKLLCYDHFIGNEACAQHSRKAPRIRKRRKVDLSIAVNQQVTPEQFLMEGSRKEGDHTKPARINMKNMAKTLRSSGKEYISQKTNKTVPGKFMKARCKENCKRTCSTIADKNREELFNAFHNLSNLTRQREFIVRHTKTADTKQKVTKKEESRRLKTIFYYFTVNDIKHIVCKKFFLNTLGISERTVRTALEKVDSSGIVDGERRGGRQSKNVKKRDICINKAIEDHIDRFPRVESHYCRQNTTKEYLHPDLSITKMHSMLLKELARDSEKPSLNTYSKIFRKKNLSFHRPKKDQCSLCLTYKQGDELSKQKLEERYRKHNAEKIKVRQLKDRCKERAKTDNTYQCGTFDLQQVLYLPVSKESALFYKRRLANYNLTYYNIATKDCTCFTWHECISKRGSSEVSTCIYKIIQDYDSQNKVKTLSLYSDGCSGQNKNSSMATMLLYAVVRSSHIEEITLRFFESYHGQNEGDSAHSAISYAVQHAGDIFQPSQLHSIFKLARRQQPYQVISLEYYDFLDFKKLSQDLRILNVRTTETRETFKWTDIMEFKVCKSNPSSVLFKTSHEEQEYKMLHLKRLKNYKDIATIPLQKLNLQNNKMSKEKYSDLMSLCNGGTPLIRSEEHQIFYRSLPHVE